MGNVSMIPAITASRFFRSANVVGRGAAAPVGVTVAEDVEDLPVPATDPPRPLELAVVVALGIPLLPPPRPRDDPREAGRRGDASSRTFAWWDVSPDE